jgi:hypothetical protein
MAAGQRLMVDGNVGDWRQLVIVFIFHTVCGDKVRLRGDKSRLRASQPWDGIYKIPVTQGNEVNEEKLLPVWAGLFVLIGAGLQGKSHAKFY